MKYLQKPTGILLRFYLIYRLGGESTSSLYWFILFMKKICSIYSFIFYNINNVFYVSIRTCIPFVRFILFCFISWCYFIFSILNVICFQLHFLEMPREYIDFVADFVSTTFLNSIINFRVL